MSFFIWHRCTPVCLPLASLKMSSKTVYIPTQATMATRVWPPALKPLPNAVAVPAQTAVAVQFLAGGPEATVQGHPYTCSKGHRHTDCVMNCA
jgi:hypothetical protein